VLSPFDKADMLWRLVCLLSYVSFGRTMRACLVGLQSPD